MGERFENNIAGRLDRLPLCSVQWKLWLVHEICWILGSVGLGTATFVLASIGNEFTLTSTTKGLVASSTYLGMFFGASLSGYLGDKFGRKKMLVISIFIWSLASLGLAWSPNITAFWVFRFFLGLGMGAQFPMTQSMLSELFPANSRGRAICLMEGGFPLACILAGLISWVALMYVDWRYVFFIQALGGLCVFMVIYKIPESARWHESVGQLDKAKEIVVAMEAQVIKVTGKSLPEIPEPIIDEKDYSNKSKLAQLLERNQIKKTLTLWTLWFCVLFGFYGLNTWISALLVNAGFSVVKSSGFVLLMYLPAIPGYLCATYFVEIYGRKKMIFSYLILAAVFCYFYGQSKTLTELFVFGCCMQFFMFGMWSLIYTYASEVFPTRIRSTGCGTTSSAGRMGSLIAPTLFGLLLPYIGNAGLFNLGAAIFFIGGTVTLIFGVETKGKRLEEIRSL
ncbi:MFS transporter [Sporomusa sp. KB1]|jgi:putative MFS transporter|uniref:MFS transporter n=1 Tax=Sporomusa sp. KB1 TaxID=943346 RepID=UPI0011A69692|nr:MFS transporter [Sporomusa sp. KB1]TWH46081.1 putative MFS transporter [Sporomusa sp. KB1]